MSLSSYEIILYKRYLALFLLIYSLTFNLVMAEDQSMLDNRLQQILSSAGTVTDPGSRIVALSGQFLDAPYIANTLHGGPHEPEQLVVTLNGFDCFTLLDVVEALRRSASAEDFTEQLRSVRYRNGVVDYAARRHFFSDWVADSAGSIKDVTSEVGQGRALEIDKQLNRRSDGTLWLPGIAVVSRKITYIPTSRIDSKTLHALRPGDYVGIYSKHAGLDVSHTGLIVKKSGQVLLRHASSRSNVKRVLDEDLLDYLRDKPGLVVYRVIP
ncbi:MAG: N-acetylmuramoyl-L-alanine amidase-like domain-containing protein [Desulfuromonadales bacterium]